MNNFTTPTFTPTITLTPTFTTENSSLCETIVDNITGCNYTSGPGCVEERVRPLPVLIFMGLAFSIIIAASICGNLLVVFAVYKNLRLRSKTNVSRFRSSLKSGGMTD